MTRSLCRGRNSGRAGPRCPRRVAPSR